MDLSRQNRFLETKYEKIEEFSSKNITIIGCGGVGSPLAELLIRGGFSKIKLIDFDVVDESNLQRQIFTSRDIGRFKAESLKNRLLEINSKIKVEIKIEQLSSNNISNLIAKTDLILDATDNFETRFLINDYAISENIPWIYSGGIRGEVICALFEGKKSKFSSIISKDVKNEDCSVGVLASTTFIAASIVYNEVIKYFQETKYTSKLIKFNVWNGKYFEVEL